MKEKKSEKSKAKSAILFLSKKKKRLLIRTLLLAGILFGINAYSWFIYIDRFGGDISASVISWDVTFWDDTEEINNIALKIDSLYPGMEPFYKEIMVENKSDLPAIFSFQIESMNLFGQEYTTTTVEESEALLTALESSFPFVLQFTYDDDFLAAGSGRLLFKIDANWDFEGETEYYQLSSYFEYDASLTYYSSDGTNYVEDATVTSENFADKLAAGLYMNSDDADTYWGHKAADYKDGNPSAPCITLNLKLIVSQKQ